MSRMCTGVNHTEFSAQLYVHSFRYEPLPLGRAQSSKSNLTWVVQPQDFQFHLLLEVAP